MQLARLDIPATNRVADADALMREFQIAEEHLNRIDQQLIAVDGVTMVRAVSGIADPRSTKFTYDVPNMGSFLLRVSGGAQALAAALDRTLWQDVTTAAGAVYRLIFETYAPAYFTFQWSAQVNNAGGLFMEVASRFIIDGRPGEALSMVNSEGSAAAGEMPLYMEETVLLAAGLHVVSVQAQEKGYFGGSTLTDAVLIGLGLVR